MMKQQNLLPCERALISARGDILSVEFEHKLKNLLLSGIRYWGFTQQNKKGKSFLIRRPGTGITKNMQRVTQHLTRTDPSAGDKFTSSFNGKLLPNSHMGMKRIDNAIKLVVCYGSLIVVYSIYACF